MSTSACGCRNHQGMSHAQYMHVCDVRERRRHLHDILAALDAGDVRAAKHSADAYQIEARASGKRLLAAFGRDWPKSSAYHELLARERAESYTLLSAIVRGSSAKLREHLSKLP